jgi:heme A synthase
LLGDAQAAMNAPQRIQLEYLALGLTFAALLLLIATCLAQSIVYRDRVYAWYALYALVTALAVAAYTGAAARRNAALPYSRRPAGGPHHGSARTRARAR